MIANGLAIGWPYYRAYDTEGDAPLEVESRSAERTDSPFGLKEVLVT